MMDTNIALENVLGLLSGDESIQVKLNFRQGLDEDDVVKLFDSLDILIKFYINKNEVPKSLAFVFVDISSDIERSLSFYPDAEQDRIFDFKEEVVAKGYELFE